MDEEAQRLRAKLERTHHRLSGTLVALKKMKAREAVLLECLSFVLHNSRDLTLAKAKIRGTIAQLNNQQHDS